MNTAKPELRSQLNLETGRLSWSEVERHFARGVVVNVATELDLIEVATAMAADDKVQFIHWLETGQVAKADSDDAIRWNESRAEFWAVVVAPWVVVQAIGREQ